MPAKGAQKRCVDGANTVQLWMLFQHLFKDLCRLHRFAMIIKQARPESPDQRMIRFDRGSLVQFGERFVISLLISEQTRAVVTDDDALCRIQANHAIKTAP